ncbi:hypothetical protein Stsp02_36170 [Streptomyces sp. NBRC 14336]|nr:hypothetical protein Stsp02_36170 [Streptomyces sp. NBRC 14336]
MPRPYPLGGFVPPAIYGRRPGRSGPGRAGEWRIRFRGEPEHGRVSGPKPPKAAGYRVWGSSLRVWCWACA